MKLVDILALHLSEWPAEDPFDLGQARDGDIHIPGHSGKYIRHLGVRLPLADNWGSENVTRSQWQAAVDALKAEKVVEWNGEGLPPVGVVCEHKRVHEWQKVEVFAVKPNYNGSHTALFTYESGTWGGCAEPSFFRPIRTIEQIAAEERDKAIDSMISVVDAGFFDNTRAIYGALYDAGYRKFEIVDN